MAVLPQVPVNDFEKAGFTPVMTGFFIRLANIFALLAGATRYVLTENRAVISDAAGGLAASDVTSTELGYLDGATSNIQSQINTHVGNTNIHIDWTNATDDFLTTGTATLDSDTGKLILGDGQDMDVYYNGTVGLIETDLIAASDLQIDCGTDKTVVLTETVWNDLIINPSALRLPTSNPPSVASYFSGQVLSFSSAADNYIYFNVQLPHSYKEGTNIKFHVHIALPTSGAGAGAENVKFDLTYSWANVTGVFPAAGSITATRDVQNDVADTHLKINVDSITGTSKTLSSVLICSLKRDTSVANDYADVVYLLSADFHYETDTIGSRQELVK